MLIATSLLITAYFLNFGGCTYVVIITSLISVATLLYLAVIAIYELSNGMYMHLKRLIKFSMPIYILLTSLITLGTLVITIQLVSPINIHIVLKYRISTSYIISSITEEGTMA